MAVYLAGNPPFNVVIYYMIRRKPGNPRTTPGDFLELLTRPAPKWGDCKATFPPTVENLLLGLKTETRGQPGTAANICPAAFPHLHGGLLFLTF